MGWEISVIDDEVPQFFEQAMALQLLADTIELMEKHTIEELLDTVPGN